MAGPGGGPPRRSHTKSRKGCETCKRRHIRCDESFPQCRNCTKHKIRCPYNDLPVPEDRRSTTPDKPDLMWADDISESIAVWRQTGMFPFPSLMIYSTPDPSQYSLEDLRLIYHLADICNELEIKGANSFTLWTGHIPALINIASTNRFVMEALLAFSAAHIASLTDCPIVGNLAYEHRGVALNGLQAAIKDFSQESSDAILAASLVLSWQATDWRSWAQLMQGTTTVIDAMEPWKQQSQFIDFINESCTFPTAPSSPNPDRKPTQLSQSDLDACEKTLRQLQKVEAHLKHNKQNVKDIQQLISFLKGSRKVNPNLPIDQQYERLRPLRTWLFNLPVTLLQQPDISPSALVVIAHYYTVALLMERMFPEIGAAYFGSLSIKPVEHIARQLQSQSIQGAAVDVHLSLIEVPLSTVDDFRSRMGWPQPPRTPSFPQFGATAFYADDHVPMAPVTDHYGVYSNPAFSYSHESLNIINNDPVSGSAVSPLTLSSPFPNPQYLGVPSPSFGGYSPASSTFDDSSWNDADNYGTYDMSGMPQGNMFGGHGNTTFGGFVSPIQPVWN